MKAFVSILFVLGVGGTVRLLSLCTAAAVL